MLSHPHRVESQIQDCSFSGLFVGQILPCDVGGAIWSQGWCILLLNEELFGTPESSKSQGRKGLPILIGFLGGGGDSPNLP